MLGRNIIVIGASAGGVEALAELVSGLAPDIPAAILVVVHIPPYAQSNLPEILSRSGPIPCAHAVDGENIQHGCIYIAPPNHHLLVEGNAIQLSPSPHVNGTRPAIDPLFLSAAKAHGPNVIGVILSGVLNDGTVGLMEIKRCGGFVVVQDPQDALFPRMPQSTLEHVSVDYILSVVDMGHALSRLAKERLPKQETPSSQVDEIMSGNMPPAEDVVEQNVAGQEHGERDGMLSVFTCPECGGSLWQAKAGTVVRFRCHTGHTMSGDALFADQAEQVEKSLFENQPRVVGC